MYQSWNETWVPPRTITTYYKSVVETMGGEKPTKDFYRLFMVPDFGMCPSLFPGTFDALRMVALAGRGYRPGANHCELFRPRVNKKRPVCAYPQVAIYKGSGDINDAANFSCGVPTGKNPEQRRFG